MKFQSFEDKEKVVKGINKTSHLGHTVTTGGTADLGTFDAKVRAVFSVLNVCQPNFYSRVGINKNLLTYKYGRGFPTRDFSVLNHKLTLTVFSIIATICYTISVYNA